MWPVPKSVYWFEGGWWLNAALYVLFRAFHQFVLQRTEFTIFHPGEFDDQHCNGYIILLTQPFLLRVED